MFDDAVLFVTELLLEEDNLIPKSFDDAVLFSIVLLLEEDNLIP